MKTRIWEDNVRQLENFIERLVALAPAEARILDTDVLPADIKRAVKEARGHQIADHSSQSLHERVTEFEAQLIRQALAANGWNQSKAARQLRMPVQTLSYKIGKYGIVK